MITVCGCGHGKESHMFGTLAEPKWCHTVGCYCLSYKEWRYCPDCGSTRKEEGEMITDDEIKSIELTLSATEKAGTLPPHYIAVCRKLIAAVRELQAKYDALKRGTDDSQDWHEQTEAERVRLTAENDRLRSDAKRRKENELASGYDGSAVREGQKDTYRLDQLEKWLDDRCVSLQGSPPRGLRKARDWFVHLNGIGYQPHCESVREAIDAAMSRESPSVVTKEKP